MSEALERTTQEDAELLAHAGDIFTAVTLPVSGRTLSNRLIKAPLYEHFAALWKGVPNEPLFNLYAKWSTGHWGAIFTGNVQVDQRHLSFGRDLSLPEVPTPETIAPWCRLADIIHTGRASDDPQAEPDAHAALGRPLALIQLSHSGRQSANVYSGRAPFEPPLAPSPIRSGAGLAGKEGLFSHAVHTLVHQQPREMTHGDIEFVIGEFVRGAQLAVQSGFDGVEVHAAHGYLVSQFISPKSNLRTDEYSADTDPLHFLRDIVYAIRAPGVVPEDFVVAIKLNSADYSRETAQLQEGRALDHVREIGSWGLIDFIEVSGGDYEDPQFIDSVANFKSPRQVIFESFAERSIEILASTVTASGRPPPLICLTGGLNTLPKMSSVLRHKHAHLLGVARQAIVHPRLPVELHDALAARAAGDSANDFFMSEPPSRETALGDRPPALLSARGIERLVFYVFSLVWKVLHVRMPRLVGAGAGVSWYSIVLRRIAADEPVPLDYTLGIIGATVRYYFAPYPPFEGGSSPWWMFAGLLGVAIGVGLGQVV
ncbi:FMN-linked oxidoreductase [Lenzites betulinus]|nr:FMN-linked oxidoreductase [Lenzites betulinus]